MRRNRIGVGAADLRRGEARRIGSDLDGGKIRMPGSDSLGARRDPPRSDKRGALRDTEAGSRSAPSEAEAVAAIGS